MRCSAAARCAALPVSSALPMPANAATATAGATTGASTAAAAGAAKDASVVTCVRGAARLASAEPAVLSHRLGAGVRAAKDAVASCTARARGVAMCGGGTKAERERNVKQGKGPRLLCNVWASLVVNSSSFVNRL